MFTGRYISLDGWLLNNNSAGMSPLTELLERTCVIRARVTNVLLYNVFRQAYLAVTLV